MIWYVVLDPKGSIINIRAGIPHGNTRYYFEIEAERLVDAQAAAPAAASAFWAQVQAGTPPPKPAPPPLERAKPGPKAKEPECACGMPRKAEDKTCRLCDELARSAPLMVDKVKREPRESDAQLVLLLEVQRQWQQSPNVGLFTKWLGGRIAALRSVR